MLIQKMFTQDISRKINGVIQVQQDLLSEEIREYVVTKELKKHFISFFTQFCAAMKNPTNDIGVWISGFFGSGKSHFLKMLSCILENHEIDGSTSIEIFRQKFKDDPGSFMCIDEASRFKNETILFNIDSNNAWRKDETAIRKIFARMFYSHLGYFGSNLKVVQLEKYLQSIGKTSDFEATFARFSKKSWSEGRKNFAFVRKQIIMALVDIGLSEEDAKEWCNDKTQPEIAVADLVDDIADYVNSQPDNFRLLFMVDEVGQFIGTNTDLLLNLQSLVEDIGSRCRGKVWVVCTGQEALDKVIKVRMDEFSRIQARFSLRLSLSSSSVDEVIQKRILEKTPEAQKLLEDQYEKNESVLRNLFSFVGTNSTITGFTTPGEFSKNFPFVPYQFALMPEVFKAIRKHGNIGTHLAEGERSMLSGFQLALQALADKNEFALAPFYLFYDNVHQFLDSSIRRVVDRCQQAADEHSIFTQKEVNVLKLLYLLRYIDNHINASLDNLVILMADNLQVDKITLKASIQKSLDLLIKENYIGHVGDVYYFMTDEEQDIQREISNTPVDTAEIVSMIGQFIYTSIYKSQKFRYKNYDFDLLRMVDDMVVGANNGGMCISFLTADFDESRKKNLTLLAESNRKALIVLSDTHYFDSAQKAFKIQKFIKQRNVQQHSESVRKIITTQLENAEKYEEEAKKLLTEAILSSEVYVCSQNPQIHSDDPQKIIDQALTLLVTYIYSKLEKIQRNAENDDEIQAVLNGAGQLTEGKRPENSEAADDIYEYLVIQHKNGMQTSMAEIQKRFKAAPYGWKEIDIAYVTAMLIAEQKITIKYGGIMIHPNDPRLVDMLRKKSIIGGVTVQVRERIEERQMSDARKFYMKYFHPMEIPQDEDGLVETLVQAFENQKSTLQALLERFKGHIYPDRERLEAELTLTKEVLDLQKDNIVLIKGLLKMRDDLFEAQEDAQRVKEFFQTQVETFDSAVHLGQSLLDDHKYFTSETAKALRTMDEILNAKPFLYPRIPELNGLMAAVSDEHKSLLQAKRAEINKEVEQFLAYLHAFNSSTVKPVLQEADNYFTDIRDQIASCQSLLKLDGLFTQMDRQNESFLRKIDAIQNPTAPASPSIRVVSRQKLFPVRRLKTEKDVEDYLAEARSQLLKLIENGDEIQVN